LPAQQHHTLTVSGPKTGRCSYADTETKRRWPSPQTPAHTRPAWRTGQPVPPAGYWHRRADRSVTECDRTTLAANACNRRSAWAGSAVSGRRLVHIRVVCAGYRGCRWCVIVDAPAKTILGDGNRIMVSARVANRAITAHGFTLGWWPGSR
jgi:hypothetical protein